MGGVRDLVSEETGALVPPGDEDALARAVTELVADPVRRRRAAAGAGEAGVSLGIEPVADAYAELYGELLSARARRAAAPGPRAI
jgi:glycosyltransferase involved in cell wall biosynthesis